MYMKCMHVVDLNAAITDDYEELPDYESDSQEIFLNFATHDDNNRMSIAGNVFQHPVVSSFTQSDDIRDEIICDQESCKGDQSCYCYNEVGCSINNSVVI